MSYKPYKPKRYDLLPIVDLAESILEMRRIYSEKDDEAFCTWYATRYGVRVDVVERVLKKKQV